MMPFRVRQILSILPFTALLAGCGVPGLPAKATVTLIDRTCAITETIDREVDDPRNPGVKVKARELNSKTGECKSVEEWEEVRAKRTKKVDGTAVVHLDYQAPQDGATHSATLTFTGRDDEFYALNAGDTIDILVAKSDPARIRKA
ncbi:MAG: hypothetical protein ABIS38_00700 [Sphingomicrobium sp.]